MSKRPTGTMRDDRLLELREIDETTASALAIDVTAVVDRMEAAAGDHIDWDIDERDQLPMLVLSRIDEAATADAPYPRQLREEESAVLAPVPDPLVRAEPPEGLGLEIDDYDPDRSLLLDVVGSEETVGFVPIRFSDGTVYGSEPLPDTDTDSDPVAEETIERESGGDPTPRPETVSAPIGPDLLESALTDVEDESAVVGLLEGIERHDVVGPDDTVAGYPPLSVENRALCVLEAGFWAEEVAPRLEAAGVEVDADALEDAREIHERQAERIVEDADEDEYREAISEYDVAVTDERDTAAWDVSEPGTSR